MANNQYVNKVNFGNETLIDLTSDTVDANKILSGYTAHDASGAPITGTIPLRNGSNLLISWYQGTAIFYAQSGYYQYSYGHETSTIQIPVPSSGTNSIFISVPNGTTTPDKDTPEDWITLKISVDSSGNSEIETLSNEST